MALYCHDMEVTYHTVVFLYSIIETMIHVPQPRYGTMIYEQIPNHM